jgi:predicted DNA-binding protein with PD1-like motif
MDYRRFGDTLVIRFDPDEEIIENLHAIAEKEQIKLASVEALGAINDFTVGVFDTVEKKYYSNRFQGAYEIVSLTGTITTKDGAFYQHLHMSAGESSGAVFGGHLSRAIVSATCEMIVRVIDGRVERVLDPDIGLNLFRFF